MQLKLVYSNGSTPNGGPIASSWPISGPRTNACVAPSTIPRPSSAPWLSTSTPHCARLPPWRRLIQAIDVQLQSLGPLDPAAVRLVARQVAELLTRAQRRLELPGLSFAPGYGLPKPRAARAFPRPRPKPTKRVHDGTTDSGRRSGRHR